MSNYLICWVRGNLQIHKSFVTKQPLFFVLENVAACYITDGYAHMWCFHNSANVSYNDVVSPNER